MSVGECVMRHGKKSGTDAGRAASVVEKMVPKLYGRHRQCWHGWTPQSTGMGGLP